MAQQSTFDPSEFEVEGALQTQMEPVPEGDYEAQIYNVQGRTGENENGPWHALDITYEILDEEVKRQLNLNSVRITDRLFIEVTEEGALARGTNKNIQLGRLAAAAGLNQSTKNWNLSDLIGRPIAIRVSQNIREMRDGQQVTDNQVRRFMPAGSAI